MARIQKLPKEVVNLIAAGEQICKPVNAVKELIENSLDAECTEINVMIKNGGMDHIQIKDNGTGISMENLQLIGERWSTSKLSNVDDMKSIKTFGFRGEAVASIAAVSRLTITSKLESCQLAHSIAIEGGKRMGNIKKCAGNNGTTFDVRNLFFNLMSGKNNGKRNNENQSQKIQMLLLKYALANPTVSFTFSADSAKVGFTTKNMTTKKEIVKYVSGNEVSDKLIDLEFKDERLRFECQMTITLPTIEIISSEVRAKNKSPSFFILFVNNRLVDWPELKRELDGIVNCGNRTTAFMYISLSIDSERIDPNIHPSKNEVMVLDSDFIIQVISDYLREYVNENVEDIKKDELVNINSLSSNRSISQLKSSDLDNSGTEQTIEKDELLLSTMGNDDQNDVPITHEGNKPFGQPDSQDNFVLENLYKQKMSEGNDNSMNNSATESDFDLQRVGFRKASELYDKKRPDLSTGSKITEFFKPQATASDEFSSTPSSAVLPSYRDNDTESVSSSFPTSGKTREYDQHKNRTLNPNRTLDEFFFQNSASQKGNPVRYIEEELKTEYQIVDELLKLLTENVDHSLRRLFQKNTFIGFALKMKYFYVQEDTTAYSIDIEKATSLLIYQKILENFGDLDVYKFEIDEQSPDSIPWLYDFLEAFIEAMDETFDEDDIKINITNGIKILIDNSEFLEKFYGLSFGKLDERYYLSTIPMFGEFVPQFEGIPVLLFRLLQEVDYTNKSAAIIQTTRAIANFIVPKSQYCHSDDEEETEDVDNEETAVLNPYNSLYEWRVIFKSQLLPLFNDFLPGPYVNELITPIVKNSDIYKVFERC
uniref:DNA_mis_repair domain-containing protein n=1 Tax=Rhabditophanes sp. KR3021 TaxID=114890 RepID=A0AC35U9F5_9BILA